MNHLVRSWFWFSKVCKKEKLGGKLFPLWWLVGWCPWDIGQLLWNQYHRSSSSSTDDFHEHVIMLSFTQRWSTLDSVNTKLCSRSFVIWNNSSQKKFYVFAGMRKNTNIVKWGGWWSWWEWFNVKGENRAPATCLNSRMSEAKMQQLNWWQRIGGNIQKRRGATQPSQQSKTLGKTGRGAVAANLLSIIQKRFCSFRRVSGCAWFWITKKQTSLF